MSARLHASTVQRARSWLADDPDPDTRRQLVDLLRRVEAGDAAAAAELSDAFAGLLQFGTAGLRGALGPGPNRMNVAVVRRAAAGLARYLLDASGHSVVIGYDARHKSRLFAEHSAAVFTGAGLRAFVLPEPLPTPVLAFAIRHLGADAGVMVTASHNPRQDNGYKVYLGDGSQIVPPTDEQIAARIASVRSVRDLPTPTTWETLDGGVLDAYVEAVGRLPLRGGERGVTMVFTPLHGVGGRTLQRAFAAAGFPEPIPVPSQYEPDPDFPTVSFPNPEEPGAMDAAIAVARAADADAVLANDPDADRCALAVPTGDGGDFRMLRGDDLGSLLGWWVLERGRISGRPIDGVFANSIVSSRLLAKIAAAAGVRHEQTLTGFKWIARVPDLVFGYEEALGYCVDPASVRDKDGIAAAILAAEMIAWLKAQGVRVQDVLDRLAREHGLYATDQLAVRVSDPAVISAAMAALRSRPPQMLAASPVVVADDLLHGPDGLPATNALRYMTADGSRVIVRPSGTEPKVKCYLEVVVDVPPGETGMVRAQNLAAGRLAALRVDIADASGLGRPSDG